MDPRRFLSPGWLALAVSAAGYPTLPHAIADDSSANGAKAPAVGAVQLRTPAERERFAEIQDAHAKAAYARLIELAQAFERDWPSSNRIPEVLNLRGLARLMRGDATGASSDFRLAIERAPDALLGDRNWKEYVRYNLAAALLDSGKPLDAAKELDAIDPESLDTPNRLKFFLLRSRCFERGGNPRGALGVWIALDRRSDELKLSEATILGNVERILAAMSSGEGLEELEKQAEGTIFADRIGFRSVELRMAEGGSTSDARDRLRLFMKSHPESPKAAEAAALLRGMREAVSTGELSIGLLVPQTGRFASIGDRVIRSAALAAGIFGGYPDQKVELVIEDCGQTPESALRALERLHSRHRVAAVLGPILSKGADAVIQRAEELALPILSLAQQGGSFGEFSFQAAVTPAMQTRELARQAIQKMGLKNFAILAPRDRFGEEYGMGFWNAVEEFGGTVTAFEDYEPGETDFRKPIDRLAGLFYPDARKRELDELAASRARDEIKKRSRKTEKYFALPPIVDFDAVFIPDEPKEASLAIPTFAYRDVDSVQILGITGWNAPEFIQRSGRSAEGAVFMDAYLPSSTQSSVRDFSKQFRGTFGLEPGSIEAVSFDAAAVLSRIVASESGAQGIDRMAVASRIRQLSDTKGVTGSISVRDGSWSRELQAVTIRNSEFTAWDARSPRPATSAD